MHVIEHGRQAGGEVSRPASRPQPGGPRWQALALHTLYGTAAVTWMVMAGVPMPMCGQVRGHVFGYGRKAIWAPLPPTGCVRQPARWRGTQFPGVSRLGYSVATPERNSEKHK